MEQSISQTTSFSTTTNNIGASLRSITGSDTAMANPTAGKNNRSTSCGVQDNVQGSHNESWRVHGNAAQMVDASSSGQLSRAEDDHGVNTCERRDKSPSAPGFERADSSMCSSGSLSGAQDGAKASRRTDARLAENARLGQEARAKRMEKMC